MYVTRSRLVVILFYHYSQVVSRGERISYHIIIKMQKVIKFIKVILHKFMDQSHSIHWT